MSLECQSVPAPLQSPGFFKGPRPEALYQPEPASWDFHEAPKRAVFVLLDSRSLKVRLSKQAAFSIQILRVAVFAESICIPAS